MDKESRIRMAGVVEVETEYYNMFATVSLSLCVVFGSDAKTYAHQMCL